jgi:hypothetical protein
MWEGSYFYNSNLPVRIVCKTKKYNSFSVLYSKDKAIEQKNNPQTG